MLYFISMFTRKIENPFEKGKCTQEKIRVKTLKLSTKLKVDENQFAYIIIKGTPLDKFATGDFELEGGMLPKTFKQLNLGKPKKHRISKSVYYANSFKGAVLFINKQEYNNLHFKTRNILLFDRLADFRFKLEGNFSFRIIDIDKFAKFIAKFGRGNEYIMHKICAFVSKKIRYEFHKEEFEIEKFLMKDNRIFEKITTKLGKRLEKVGIEVFDLSITDCILNKRNQMKINEFVSMGDIKLRYSIFKGEDDVISQ